MTLAQMIARLTRGYIKATGKQPVGLDKLKIKMEAAEKLRQMNKVIPFPQQKSFKQEIDNMIKSGDINVGTAPKTPPYQKSQADIDFEIMERIKSDNEKAIRGFESRNPKKPTEDKADGGRTGYFLGSMVGKARQQKDGIEERLEQLGGDVSSAEQMLQEINKRLQTAESGLGGGGGQPFYGGLGANNQLNVTEPQTPVAMQAPLGGDNNGFNFRQEGDMGRYIADNDPGGLMAGYSSYQDYLGAGNDPVSRPQGQQTLQSASSQENLQRALPGLFADGGVAGLLGERQNFAMGRRAFLKLMGGLGAGIGAAKAGLGSLFKTSKPVSKLPIIKTDNVAGKPEWFDTLVNKVILEGDDVTKKFATSERQSIHQKKLDDNSIVRVTEDVDNGAVRVEYESPENVYGDSVQLQYKKPLPDEGNPNPAAEFDVAESGPVGRADGPDDYSIEIDEVGGTSIKDLSSDVSKLKEYATGKKPNIKEMMQNKKRKDKAKTISEGGEGEMDEVIRRQGEFIENDLVDLDPGDFASGGIAKMLGE